MSEKIKSQLIAIKELLSDSKHWIKGNFAKDNYGLPCFSKSDTATCWYLSGAIRKVTDEDYEKFDLFDVLALNIPNRLDSSETSVIHFNDTSDHSDVLKLIDRTIDAIR